MRTLRLWVALILSLCIKLTAQSGSWELQNPWPTGALMKSIWPVTHANVIVTGVSTLLKTTDSGASWKSIKDPSSINGEKSV